MQVQTISVRELHNVPAIARGIRQGKSYVVVKHSKPLFNIVPTDKMQPKTHTMKDLLAISFKGGKHLSRDIDKILYG